MEKKKKYLKKCEDQGAFFSPLPFESFGLAEKEELELVSNLVKKVSQSIKNIDFALLLSYWKKRISTTLQVYYIIMYSKIYSGSISVEEKSPKKTRHYG